MIINKVNALQVQWISADFEYMFNFYNHDILEDEDIQSFSIVLDSISERYFDEDGESDMLMIDYIIMKLNDEYDYVMGVDYDIWAKIYDNNDNELEG